MKKIVNGVKANKKEAQKKLSELKKLSFHEDIIFVAEKRFWSVEGPYVQWHNWLELWAMEVIYNALSGQKVNANALLAARSFADDDGYFRPCKDTYIKVDDSYDIGTFLKKYGKISRKSRDSDFQNEVREFEKFRKEIEDIESKIRK